MNAIALLVVSIAAGPAFAGQASPAFNQLESAVEQPRGGSAEQLAAGMGRWSDNAAARPESPLAVSAAAPDGKVQAPLRLPLEPVKLRSSAIERTKATTGWCMTPKEGVGLGVGLGTLAIGVIAGALLGAAAGGASGAVIGAVAGLVIGGVAGFALGWLILAALSN